MHVRDAGAFAALLYFGGADECRASACTPQIHRKRVKKDASGREMAAIVSLSGNRLPILVDVDLRKADPAPMSDAYQADSWKSPHSTVSLSALQTQITVGDLVSLDDLRGGECVLIKAAELTPYRHTFRCPSSMRKPHAGSAHS
ncbi:hypothetical protein DDJ45_17060 [Mycobacteroides abscessus]|nr:hypothetical protein DDJ45_17060 [Mycobacteroides abscessus]